MSAHILIAGGGIGGLTAALALARRGHAVTLFEQAAAFGEIGAGLQLGPNATRRLHALGLASALAEVAARPQRLVVRDALDDHELAHLPLGDAAERRYGAPYLCLHRADLHALLLQAVRQGGQARLHAAQPVRAVRPQADGVELTLADATVHRGDALLGADGLWSSAVRACVVPSDGPHGGPPHSTGQTSWRALVPQAQLPAALRNGTQVQVWLGARLHAVSYPVRGGDWLNLVVSGEGVADAGAPPDPRDWDQATSLQALQRATGHMGHALQRLLEAMPGWRAWSLHDRAPLAGSQQMAAGRVALLGDAAHPMLPYLGQGAGMAIEDAAVLAEALGEGGASAVPLAFARYARARWQRAARVQATSRRNAAIFHACGPLRVGRDLALRLLGERLLDQPWLYGG